jgi:TolA-binding protein
LDNLKKLQILLFCLLIVGLTSCGHKKKVPIEPPPTTTPSAPIAPAQPEPATPPETTTPPPSSKPPLSAPAPKPRAPAPGDPASNKLVESGVKQMNSGALPEAQDFFEQALRVSPNNGRPYYYMGVLAAKQKQWQRSNEFLEQAENHLQGNGFWMSQVLLQEGLNYKALNNLSLARQKFQEALKQDPTNAAAQKEIKNLKP